MKQKKLIIIFSIIAIIIIYLVVAWFFFKNETQPLFYYGYNGTSDVITPTYRIYSDGKTLIEDNLSVDGGNKFEGQLSKESLEELKKDIKELKDISSQGNPNGDVVAYMGDYFCIKGKKYDVSSNNVSKLNEIIKKYFEK